jgi:hypothetical protein
MAFYNTDLGSLHRPVWWVRPPDAASAITWRPPSSQDSPWVSKKGEPQPYPYFGPLAKLTIPTNCPECPPEPVQQQVQAPCPPCQQAAAPQPCNIQVTCPQNAVAPVQPTTSSTPGGIVSSSGPVVSTQTVQSPTNQLFAKVGYRTPKITGLGQVPPAQPPAQPQTPQPPTWTGGLPKIRNQCCCGNGDCGGYPLPPGCTGGGGNGGGTYRRNPCYFCPPPGDGLIPTPYPPPDSGTVPVPPGGIVPLPGPDILTPETDTGKKPPTTTAGPGFKGLNGFTRSGRWRW